MTKRPLALVTGATSGIGKAVTLALANAGYDALALGRNIDALDQLNAHENVRPLCVDLTDRATLASSLEGIDVDVLVNNAGMIPPIKPFDQIDQADIDATIAVNLNASLATTRLLLPAMIARKSGHVFFTGSTAGHAPFPNMAVYGASKAALSSFAAGLRCDVSGSGVRVTEIVAGRVKTGLYRGVVDDQSRTEMYSAFDAVQPEDVARMLLTVLEMPTHVDVTRFDILPTAQYVGGGGFAKKEG